jgi:hypothetical protein
MSDLHNNLLKTKATTAPAYQILAGKIAINGLSPREKRDWPGWAECQLNQLKKRQIPQVNHRSENPVSRTRVRGRGVALRQGMG